MYKIERVVNIMSKGSIRDCRISLKPSPNLIDFICSLSDQNSLPENLLNIYKSYGNDHNAEPKSVSPANETPTPVYSKEEYSILQDLSVNCGDSVQQALAQLSIATENCTSSSSDDETDRDDIETLDDKPISKNAAKRRKEQRKQKIRSRLTVNLNDLRWLNALLGDKRKADPDCAIYLHELLQSSKLILPRNEIVERNPELEARCVKLRLQQDARRYQAMTKNVDTSKKHIPEDTIAYQS